MEDALRRRLTGVIDDDNDDDGDDIHYLLRAFKRTDRPKVARTSSEEEMRTKQRRAHRLEVARSSEAEELLTLKRRAGKLGVMDACVISRQCEKSLVCKTIWRGKKVCYYIGK